MKQNDEYYENKKEFLEEKMFKEFEEKYPINTFPEVTREQTMRIVESAYRTGVVDGLKQAMDIYKK